MPQVIVCSQKMCTNLWKILTNLPPKSNITINYVNIYAKISTWHLEIAVAHILRILQSNS